MLVDIFGAKVFFLKHPFMKLLRDKLNVVVFLQPVLEMHLAIAC